ncbi:hypothetical protein DUNSADRAFT_7514 [Dunaliella salina]|uniref:Uncharacterized protein n=1 Tax=Dunaliella salina TaxID=3046 RepID=A0ABQ7FT99_DUNSA|nr:hypothetical protein DUNSADRAFT_7514 [Dunaliella salina]|eukprot:KAF5825697.1 hypothetical protein DUNSADRAFT_7514 [Dunaliella salina]
MLDAIFLWIDCTGIDKLCAKLIFVTSQITVVDELKRRQRAVSLSLFDFVEALARLSEVLSPPAPDELAAWLSGRYQSAVSTQSAVSHPSAVSPRGSLGGVERGTSEPGAAAAPAHDASLAPNKARSNGGSNSGSSSGGSNGIRSKRLSSAIGNEGMPELAGVVMYFKVWDYCVLKRPGLWWKINLHG